MNLLTRRTLLYLPLLTLLGCPKPPETTTTTASPDPKKPAKKLKIGLVTDTGGVDDKSFNAAAWKGLQRAKAELGAEIKYVESKSNADYVPNLTQFGRAKYDLVFALGFKMQDALKSVAPQFPKVKFAIIDGDAPNDTNCVSYKFREEEGSFLAGALAGAMTKSGIVGFIGGEEMPLILKFQAGFTAGVQQTNPNASVLVGYAGSFNDPQKGMELATSQISQRADILYHASGATGTGVIKAVASKGKGFYAIGVDLDQDDLAPGRVLTSMVKRVDTAVFEVCKSVSKNTFTSGTIELGLKEAGVALSEMKHTKKDIPADVLAKIEEIRQQVIEEEIRPPKTMEELERFGKKDQ